MKLDLQVRDLKTGETGPKSFESVEAAIEWLANRPKYVDVLGVASFHVPAEVSERMKAAMRPLDDEEKKLDAELRQARDRAAEEAARRRASEEAAAAALQLAEQASADPEREMDVHWTYKDGLGPGTPGDNRPLTDEVKAAVAAWIAERNSWVEGRGQVVGDARIKLWPGTVPKGQERIISGTFVPVTAPKKS